MRLGLLQLFTGIFLGVMGYIYFEEKPQQVITPEPVLSKCDSIIFANDSIMQEKRILANRVLTYKLGLEQLKMVDKEAADYIINSGNFKFTERW
jgi:hypothetical protein